MLRVQVQTEKERGVWYTKLVVGDTVGLVTGATNKRRKVAQGAGSYIPNGALVEPISSFNVYDYLIIPFSN